MSLLKKLLKSQEKSPDEKYFEGALPNMELRALQSISALNKETNEIFKSIKQKDKYRPIIKKLFEEGKISSDEYDDLINYLVDDKFDEIEKYISSLKNLKPKEEKDKFTKFLSSNKRSHDDIESWLLKNHYDPSKDTDLHKKQDERTKLIKMRDDAKTILDIIEREESKM